MPKEYNSRQLVEYCENATSRLVSSFSELEDVYKYVAPGRVNFDHIKNSGGSKTEDIYDSTALNGVRTWANNVQSILMPPQKKWYSLGIGSALERSKTLGDAEKEKLKETLQEYTDILFDTFNQSNVYMVLNEAFQDLAVSTGVISVSEENTRVGISFKSVPLSEIVFEENANNRIDRFYRTIKMSARNIVEKWGEIGNIPQEILKINESKPDETVDILEGSIELTDDKRGKYFYFVIYKDKKSYIYSEYKNYPPFIAFRMVKRPGDILGYGICRALMPTIRFVNLLKYYLAKANKFAAFPAYLATKSGAFNPFTAILEPGSIIPVDPGFASNPPIMPLESGGNLQFASVSIETLQNEINEALFVNPLGNVATTKDRTASEMQLRQENWAKQNAVGIGRLTNELILPIISATLTILRKRGVISDISSSLGTIKVDDTTAAISIDFNSPLVGVQDREDAQNLVQFMQIINEMLGPSAMSASVDIATIPQYIAEKMNIYLKLVKNKEEIKQVMQQAAQAMQQQQVEEAKASSMAQSGTPAQTNIPFDPLGLNNER